MSSHFKQVGQQEYEIFIENNTKINSIVQNRRGFSCVHWNDTGMVPYFQAHKTIIGAINCLSEVHFAPRRSCEEQLDVSCVVCDRES